jgi:uncharacterized membrane protein
MLPVRIFVASKHKQRAAMRHTPGKRNAFITLLRLSASVVLLGALYEWALNSGSSGLLLTAIAMGLLIGATLFIRNKRMEDL